jgi:hypothetical protein
MIKWTKLLAVCGTGLLSTAGALLLLSSLPLLSQGETSPADAALENGGFEETYREVITDCEIAQGWNLWYTTHWAGESLASPRAGESDDHRQGSRSQHLYPQLAKNFDACVYQQVGGITVGHYVQFSAWARVNAHEWLDAPEKWQTRIGIDPQGRENPLDIQYELHPNHWDVYDTHKGEWQKLSVAIKALSTTVTVYACAHPVWPVDFHVRWDGAEFSQSPERLTHMPFVTWKHFVMPPGELYNPGLERDFGTLVGYQAPISGFTNVLVAPYWMPFWNDDYDSETWENKQPEYNYTDRSYRVHSGQVAQQMGLSGWGGFEAGLYQVVTGTQVGDVLQFAIWGQGWSSDDPGNERYSDVRQGLNFRVGIDPYGGKSYTSTNIMWSDYDDPYDEWHQLQVTATAHYTRVSVWAYAHPLASRIRFNQTFWDDASLTVVHSPQESTEKGVTELHRGD